MTVTSVATESEAAAASQGTGTTLLLVDVQNDFHPGGSLAIPSANEDAERIANIIKTYPAKINRIVATLDSHHKLHIAHPYFWVKGEDDGGNNNNNNNSKDGSQETSATRPEPFTIISADDIASGKWKPRSDLRIAANTDEIMSLDPTIFENVQSVQKPQQKGEFDLQKYCLEYARRLEQRGRFQICIWPEHCLIGSEGHAIVPTVRRAMEEWSAITGRTVEFVHKGQHLLTEMYSALAADVPVSIDTTFNSKLHRSLLPQSLSPAAAGGCGAGNGSTKLVVCGQAMSHCVNYTLRDIVEHCTTKHDVDRIYLLKDCASAVPGFEAAAETFQEDMKKAGVHLVTSLDLGDIL